MNRLILNQRQIDLIRSFLGDETLNSLINIKEIKKNNHSTGKYLIFISNEDKKKILDKLTLEFSNRGINTDYEPNSLGLEIEELIDIINNNI